MERHSATSNFINKDNVAHFLCNNNGEEEEEEESVGGELVTKKERDQIKFKKKDNK